jgi:hypothetical protein
MNTKQKWAAAAAFVATGGGLVAGLAGPVDASGPGVYVRTTSASVDLSADGSPVVLTKVRIPKGDWIITAKANPVSFGAADYVRCRIVVGNTQKDAGATLLGNASGGPTGETGPSVATIALQTAVTTTSSKNVKLDCQHDFPQAGEYVDPGASLMVERAPGPVA